MWLVDISRLMETLHLATPTGIDRVEMAYAQHFLKTSQVEDVRFVVTWPTYTSVFRADQARPLIEAMASRWSAGGRDIASDGVYAQLASLLGREVDSRRERADWVGKPASKGPLWAPVRSAVGAFARGIANRLTDRHIAEFRSSKARFLHVSQFRLNRPKRFEWLAQARAESLFLLHDLIPVTHPEYCRPGEAARHARRVETMLDHASIIIANSQFTRSSLEHFCRIKGRKMPRCDVVGLGVDRSFLPSSQATPKIAATVPYFVVIGTIEPRKNLAFLLHVWQRWTKAGSDPRARLVIVGRRGWENENVLDLLERSPALASTVVEVSSLSDAGLAELLRGASALLLPSFVEGFGLPIVEAMALGVPVIASDIAAFREVGGDFIDYVEPTDGMSWAGFLEEFSSPGSAHRARRVDTLSNFRPVSWPEHVRAAETLFLDAVC